MHVHRQAMTHLGKALETMSIENETWADKVGWDSLRCMHLWISQGFLPRSFWIRSNTLRGQKVKTLLRLSIYVIMPLEESGDKVSECISPTLILGQAGNLLIASDI